MKFLVSPKYAICFRERPVPSWATLESHENPVVPSGQEMVQQVNACSKLTSTCGAATASFHASGLHVFTRACARAFLVLTFDASIPTSPQLTPTTYRHSHSLYHTAATDPLLTLLRVRRHHSLVIRLAATAQSASSRALSSTTPARAFSAVSYQHRTTLSLFTVATGIADINLCTCLRFQHTAGLRTALSLAFTI